MFTVYVLMNGVPFWHVGLEVIWFIFIAYYTWQIEKKMNLFSFNDIDIIVID